MAGLLGLRGEGPKAAPTPQRDSVEEASGEMRRLRKRRGGGANELLGAGGAEASSTAPKQLTGE
jgi:hypothetical protein